MLRVEASKKYSKDNELPENSLTKTQSEIPAIFMLLLPNEANSGKLVEILLCDSISFEMNFHQVKAETIPFFLQ